MFKLTWNSLLSDERIPLEGNNQLDPNEITGDERKPFEQDYDRIVFSRPFRRLARKTQVHPMAANDHIHNRLTHSLEVASVGRSFAIRVYDLLRETGEELPENALFSLTWIMQSACLIHDIGNPPFGHAGEEVIREWTREHEKSFFPVKHFTGSEEQLNKCKSDWLNFEGNAQGFRFASRSDNQIAGCLRLTFATLGSAIKYPWTSNDDRTSEKKKHNVYTSEESIFQRLTEKLGLRKPNGSICRHPLSFLVEAADDICYRILDLEDAVEMSICEEKDVVELFRLLSKMEGSQPMELSHLRGQAIGSLINQCWCVFKSNYDTIMSGEREEDLRSSLDRSTQEQLDKVKEIYEDIFSHRRKVATELGAYHVLGRILTSMCKTIESIHDKSSYKDIHFLSKRCIELTWGRRFVEENIDKSYDWWSRQVMDYVSGMTDDYATSLSREIGGFSLDSK